MEDKISLKLKFNLYILQSLIYHYMHDLLQSNDTLEKSIEVYNVITEQERDELYKTRNDLANDFTYNPLLDYDYAYLLNLKGLNFHLLGKFDKSLSNYFDSLELRRQYGNNYDKANTMNSIGVLYSRMGNLEEAKQYFSNSKSEFEKLGNTDKILTIIQNTTFIAQRKHDFEEAFRLAKEALSISFELNDFYHIGYSYFLIALTYKYSGKLNKADEYLQKILQFKESINDEYFVSDCLYNSILINCELENFDTAKMHLLSLKIIDKKSEIKAIGHMNRVAMARYTYTTQPDKSEQVKQIYYELIDDDLIFHWIRIDCMLHLADILLDEFNIADQIDPNMELNQLIDNFLSSVDSLDAPDLQLKCKLYLLKYRVSLLTNTGSPVDLLDNAIIQANEVKNHELIEEIELEKVYLKNNQFNKNRLKEKVQNMISMEIKYHRFTLELLH